MLGPGGTMSGMYFDDARGLRQVPVNWHSSFGVRQPTRIRDDSQEKEQEMEAIKVVPSVSGLGPLKSCDRNLCLQRA